MQDTSRSFVFLWDRTKLVHDLAAVLLHTLDRLSSPCNTLNLPGTQQTVKMDPGTVVVASQRCRCKFNIRTADPREAHQHDVDTVDSHSRQLRLVKRRCRTALSTNRRESVHADDIVVSSRGTARHLYPVESAYISFLRGFSRPARMYCLR